MFTNFVRLEIQQAMNLELSCGKSVLESFHFVCQGITKMRSFEWNARRIAFFSVLLIVATCLVCTGFVDVDRLQIETTRKIRN